MRLENTYNILDRTLTTLDENPEIVKGLLETADSAVETTGQIGQQATKPGGALSELTSGVGDTLGNLGNSIGDGLSTIAGKGSPKQLLSGEKSSNGSSNGSDFTKRAATAGAIGLLGGAAGRSRQPQRQRRSRETDLEGAQADHRLDRDRGLRRGERACGPARGLRGRRGLGGESGSQPTADGRAGPIRAAMSTRSSS